MIEQWFQLSHTPWYDVQGGHQLYEAQIKRQTKNKEHKAQTPFTTLMIF